jgi:hypothetical protein
MSLFRRHKTKHQEAGSRKDQAVIDRGLRAIYLDAKGQVPSLDTFERTSSWRVAWVFVVGGLGCLILAGLAWGGFWLFGRGAPVAASALAVAIQGPAQVALGEEQTYELVWHNTDSQILRDVELRLNAPLDFTVTALEPAPNDLSLRRWRLGLVQPGATGHIFVKGFFVGSLGEQSALQVLSTYRPNASEGLSEQTLLQTIRYSGTVLAGNILFPARVLAGEPTQIRYAVANLGKQPLDRLLIRFSFPAGFIPSSNTTGTRIDLATRTALFSVGTLAPGSFYTATLPGLFASGVSGDALFQAETGRSDVDGGLLVAARSEARLAIAPGDVTVQLVVNGGDTARSIEPGEPIRATLAYENVSNTPVRDVKISVQLESVVNGRSATGTSLVNWMRVDDPRQGTSSTRARFQTLTYDKSTIPLLAELPPRGRGTIEIGWPTLPVASGTKDALIRVSSQTQAFVAGETAPRLIRSQPIILTYRTDAHVSVESRYFTEEGAPLGAGPLPPVMGKMTSYRIYWNLHKTLHDLSEASVTAVLPKIVAWTGKAEASVGVVVYDEKTRTVRWDMGRVGENVHDAQGWFEVALTPQSIDVGRFASLLGETSFDAQDARLNEHIHTTRAALTTDLADDEGARGKGVVRKE